MWHLWNDHSNPHVFSPPTSVIPGFRRALPSKSNLIYLMDEGPSWLNNQKNQNPTVIQQLSMVDIRKLWYGANKRSLKQCRTQLSPSPCPLSRHLALKTMEMLYTFPIDICHHFYFNYDFMLQPPKFSISFNYIFNFQLITEKYLHHHHY